VKRANALVPLSREHHTALVLCLRIEREVPDADEGGIRAVFDDLISFWARGLLPHFRAENECLLARLVRHVSPEDELVSRTQRDHLHIEALVARMRDEPDLTARRRILKEFGDSLRTHIRWEEDILFGATEQQLTPDEMAALGQDIVERVGDGETGARDVWPAVMNRGRESSEDLK
jgi:hypothetical protein